jgi:8-hydroxy-5-deazaflavin:NADPH oxidoreductase
MSATPAGPISTIGIFGAGKSGVAIGRRALAAGYGVRIATSGPAGRTALVTAVLTPGAIAVDAAALASSVGLVILAVPLRRFRELPLTSLVGSLVVDVMNYWPPIDGILPEFEGVRPSSELVREALPPTTRLVKTLNHIGYHEIEELARPAGTPGRVALAIAGDDPDALDAVAHFVDDLGFDPVAAGSLAESAVLQPGSPVFGADVGETAMRDELAAITSRSGAR